MQIRAFRPSLGIPLAAALLGLLTACGGGEPKHNEAPAQPKGAPESAPKTEPPKDKVPATGQAPAAAPTSPVAQTNQAQSANQPAAATQLAATNGEQVAADGHDHRQPDPSANLLRGEMERNGRLDVEQSDFDFGNAVEGEVLSHTFGLKSSGPGDLMIMSAKPTCGCTVGTVEVKAGDEWRLYNFGDKVTPGTELRLNASLDTKNKKSLAASKINIFCNDPRGTVTLGLTAKLDSYFNVAPNAIDFGEMSVADAATRRIEVSAKQPGAFLLNLEPVAATQGFKVKLEPVAPDADGRSERWNVEVELGPDAPEGNLGLAVSLSSDREIAGAKAGPDGKTPHYGVTVMCSARVRGLISFEPHYLSFGLVRPGQVVPRTFTVKSYDPDFTFPSDLAAHFIGANDNTPEFKWADHFSSTIRPSADGKGVDVELTLNGLPQDADGSFQGRLVLATGHPKKPEVQVLFSGVCRAGVTAPTATPAPPAPHPQGGK
jgi:Protein of unknown function (DUF1573)